ncbi:hypothetical protein [Streptomyces corynorhini]|uniref:PrsW family intramembrane metalloprotease n=1 Tax=Streptomyces corynorhini TaxID=2282652 RepID=A0A370B537_9ACTN|nr:hypothetical protein [Streptomyces corynorhini]RDG34505.1 hypothetical protein DVH02_30235 [Streptomyces corynorhini]
MTVIPLAVAAVVLTAATASWLLRHLAGRDPGYLWLLCCGLGSSALVNLAVKQPLAHTVASAGGVEAEVGPAAPLWFLVFALLLPPVAEEAVKAAPALLPAVRARARRSWLLTGIALGTGYGIGEAGFVAGVMAVSGDHAGTPWWHFSFFAAERVVASFGHGVMTALVLRGFFADRPRRLLGCLAAVALHGLLNLGPFLNQVVDVPPVLLALGLPAGVVVPALVFAHLLRQGGTGVVRAEADRVWRPDWALAPGPDTARPPDPGPPDPRPRDPGPPDPRPRES